MLVDYGSDSDASEDEQVNKAPPKPVTQTIKPKATPATSLSAALPKPRRRDGPLKITLEAPKRSNEDGDISEMRPVKKLKQEGAGASSLLAMLPPPKNKNATLPKKKDDTVPKPLAQLPAFSSATEDDEMEPEDDNPSKALLSLVPPSRLAKGKEVPKSKEETQMDFFALGTNETSSKLPATASFKPPPPLFNKSAAPTVHEFKPPEPTPNDEYPGYYKMPNGEWAMHEPGYYWSIANSWQKPRVEDEVERRADPAERKRKRWEGDEEDFQQVSAMDEASRTRAEIESQKSLTLDAIRAGPTAPNMKMTAARSSRVAKSRHQLSTLLTDAYSHRAEIEDKIAMARRNRKESGHKYGF